MPETTAEERIKVKAQEIIRLNEEIRELLTNNQENSINYKYRSSCKWYSTEIRIQAHKIISDLSK